jgi:hypothetical protein
MYVRIKPGIDCAQLPREAVFVDLPRKVDSMLPRGAPLPRAIDTQPYVVLVTEYPSNLSTVLCDVTA